LSLLIVTAAFNRTPCGSGLHGFQGLHGEGGDDRVDVAGGRGDGHQGRRGGGWRR
jgi:hypothetical protein